jgi:hypothetical protein
MRGFEHMRVLSQSEIDNILAELLANPGVLPGSHSNEGKAEEKAQEENK